MKTGSQFFVLIVLIFIFGFSAGCTSSSPSYITQTTTQSTTPIVTPTATTVTPVISATTVIPVTVNSTTTVTPAPEADPTDITQIEFTHYSDSDFSLDYPSAWTVSNATYTSSICTSTATARCYQNETRMIGPFNFKENDNLQKPSRIIAFTSVDGKQKIVAFISDFQESQIGNYRIKPTIEWGKRIVSINYPDVSADFAIGDYRYGKNGNTMISSYTVTMPAGSAAYPLAYTMNDFVTVHHFYEFAFISDTENIQKYRNLKDWILSSIITNDSA